MSTTHEAGWAHASGALRGPSWLRPPSDPDALVPHLWSQTAHKVDGELHVGGLSVSELVANVNTPAYVLDEVDFRARAGAFRDAFAGYDGYYVSIDVLLTWGTTRFAAIPVRHAPRLEGVSNYTVRKLVNHAMNMMTGFSTFPLQIASLVGFGFTLFGFAVLAWVLGRWVLQGSVVPGFPFLASVIAIFSGAQLFALGIIGEYLARVHFRTMNRPPYSVRALSDPPASTTGGRTA